MRKDMRDLRRNDNRELKQGRFGFFLEESLLDELRTHAARSREEMSEIARRAIANEVRGAKPSALSGTDSFRSPYLSRVPCGPWAEAIDSGGSFTISTEAADELEARPGDVWVRAEGQSMEGAGISDGVLVLMRPLPEGRAPRRGEIVLVQVFVDDGDGSGESNGCALSTIKHWQPPSSESGIPQLFDGDGKPFELPQDTVRVIPIAVARGVLGRL